ncbi:hypothetical protein DB771_11580 [Burkholderia sp. AU29985]|nr:hypothetical protein XM57_06010 [Burkholderia cepacia]AYZ97285.1 hypothetical protein EGY28_19845 [Burkholderia dolosa]ETP66758.1 hypothetical protein BDSB_02555 [Burkholderia dolosa PC543]PUA76740.1 hypothetical protein DB771_11580 [Burkholderia sp. AU29985]
MIDGRTSADHARGRPRGTTHARRLGTRSEAIPVPRRCACIDRVRAGRRIADAQRPACAGSAIRHAHLARR